MAISQGMELILSLNAAYNGNENFSRASQALGKLQDATKKFQDTAGKVQDFQKANDSLAKLQEQHEKIKSEYASTSEKIKDAKTHSAELKAQYNLERESLREKNSLMRESQSAYQAQAEKVSQLAAQLQNTPDGENRKALTAQLEAERAKLKTLSKTQKENEKNYRAQEKAVKNASQEYKRSQTEIKNLESSEQKLAEKIKTTGDALQEQQNNFRKVESEINQAGINVEKFISQQDRMAAAMERSKNASDNLKAIKENLSWDSVKNKVAMPAMATYATIQPMLKLAGDFEAAMARVKAVGFSGVNADLSQFEEMKALAAQLGADTQFTSIQAANSMENLMRAGMSAQDVMKAMPALLNMAAAEGMDLAQGASIMAGALKGFDNKVSSEKIADLLAFTSANSATSISALGEAVKVAASTASKLNIKPEQLLSYLGSLANRQVEGSQAGSTITNALTRLSKSDTQKKLAQLGIATRTKNGEMVELPTILRQFAEKTKDKGEVWQIDKMSEIFGTGYGKYMVGFMSEVVSNAQKELQTGLYDKADNTSKRMASINLDTLNGQLTILSSAWDGFRTQIGDIFAPIMRTGVEALSTALSKISAIMKNFPVLSKGVVLTLGAIASYKTISGIASIAKSFVSLPGAFLEVVNAGRNVSSVLASVGASAANTSGLFATMAGSMKNIFGALVSPITGAFNLIKIAALSSLNLICAHPLIAGGVALVAGVIMLAKNWDAVKEKLSRVCDFCREKWQALSDWWASWTFPNIWQGLKDSFFETLQDLKTMWGNICEFFSNLNPFKGRGEKANAAITSARNIKASDPNPFAAMDNISSAGIFPGFATGGIIQRPSVIQVAEDGPEAIIPLRDKSRGIPLLMQAASSLGVMPENISPEFQPEIIPLVNSAKSFDAFPNLDVVKNNNSGDNSLEFFSGSVYDNGRSPFLFSRSNDGSSVRNFNNWDVAPVININVSGNNNDDDNLAQKIAAAVRNAWDEIQSRQERLSFA